MNTSLVSQVSQVAVLLKRWDSSSQVLGRLWKGGHALYCLQGNPIGGTSRPVLQYLQTANEKDGSLVQQPRLPVQQLPFIPASSRAAPLWWEKFKKGTLTGEPQLKIP